MTMQDKNSMSRKTTNNMFDKSEDGLRVILILKKIVVSQISFEPYTKEHIGICNTHRVVQPGPIGPQGSVNQLLDVFLNGRLCQPLLETFSQLRCCLFAQGCEARERRV